MMHFVVQEEKLQLVNELQASVIQNTELMEKIFKSEMAMDCLKEKLHEIKETTKLDHHCFHNCLKCSNERVRASN